MQNYQSTFIKSQSAAVDEQRRVLRQCAMTNLTKGALYVAIQSLVCLFECRRRRQRRPPDNQIHIMPCRGERPIAAKYHVVHLSCAIVLALSVVLFVAHNGPALENVKWFFDGL